MRRIVFRHSLLLFLSLISRQHSSILDGDGKLNRAELDFFLKGNLALQKSERKKPFDWIPAQGWEDLIQLQTVSLYISFFFCFSLLLFISSTDMRMHRRCLLAAHLPTM